MVARGRKIQQLPERGNGNLNLGDRLPLIDSNGTAHHTSLQSIKDLIGGSGGSSGVLLISGEQEAQRDLAEVSEFAILVDATNQPVECILPAPSLGKHFVFKKIDSSTNTVTISTRDVATVVFRPPVNGSAGQPVPSTREVMIDGQATQTLFQQYESLTLISDGNNWFIL